MKYRHFIGVFWLLALLPFAGFSQSDEGEKSVEGFISSRSGDLVTVLFEAGDIPDKGTACKMSKYFEREIFGAMATGWMGIANVEVQSAGSNKLVLKVVEETSNVVINGEKVDQFKIGNKVKCVWGVADATFDE